MYKLIKRVYSTSKIFESKIFESKKLERGLCEEGIRGRGLCEKGIRGRELVICKKCLHYMVNDNQNPYEIGWKEEEVGKCQVFGEVNMITGEIEYDLANKCRKNESKCGKLGREYIEKK